MHNTSIMRVVILPGMGCTPVTECNWYSWFKDEVERRNHQCILKEFPEPYKCRESVWIPFIENEIGLDDDTILVGHSTGAACAMRILEKSEYPLRGVILVAAAFTDLGDRQERASEYFNRTWNWGRMKKNAQVIHQFHGTDDHLIPVAEGRHVARMLQGQNFLYQELPGKSHFFEPFTEIVQVLDMRF